MVTAIIGKDHFRTEVIASGKTVIVDEAEELGGTNAGPSPGELMLISLASCTAITLRMYADRKKWEVSKITVEVASEKMSSKTIFNCEISLEGDLEEDQRQRLLQIANACPIHRLLTNPIEVNTILT